MPLDSLLRTVRLVSGLALLAFVTAHLSNLILGLHSLEAMQRWCSTLLWPWQTPWGERVLAASAVIHALLGLYAIAARRSLALSRTDAVQLALGLSVPPLLITHVLAMRVTGELTRDFSGDYGFILAFYWSYAPFYAFQQLLAVVAVWIHGALGLYSWLVLKPAWRKIGGLLLPLLFIVPLLSLIGFAESGKEVLAKLASDPAWKAEITANVGRASSVAQRLAEIQSNVLTIYAALLTLAVFILCARIVANRMKPVSIVYDTGEIATGRRGLSILELSLLNRVPHAHVCSGRGRCGTCRVRVSGTANLLNRVDETERRMLARLDAAPDVRLACKARVLGGGLMVTRLLPAYADADAARDPMRWEEEHRLHEHGLDAAAEQPA
ncbi:2Fe-2S iron-sulfur cluster-binding protein [Terrarubrum flagellatum]|uniref:2Fe-2S iron-sulfur cluster-binding protein n=1 Tax=Terrirubrum flagellatum TaxID=2895980 RepID=UPI003144E14E